MLLSTKCFFSSKLRFFYTALRILFINHRWHNHYSRKWGEVTPKHLQTDISSPDYGTSESVVEFPEWGLALSTNLRALLDSICEIWRILFGLYERKFAIPPTENMSMSLVLAGSEAEPRHFNLGKC